MTFSPAATSTGLLLLFFSSCVPFQDYILWHYESLCDLRLKPRLNALSFLLSLRCMQYHIQSSTQKFPVHNAVATGNDVRGVLATQLRRSSLCSPGRGAARRWVFVLPFFLNSVSASVSVSVCVCMCVWVSDCVWFVDTSHHVSILHSMRIMMSSSSTFFQQFTGVISLY